MIDNQFVKIRRDLHKIPELGFQEVKTQKYLLDYIATLDQTRIELKTWRTGIILKVKGLNPSKTIGYRADIDGLPIDEETDYPFQSTHKGKMHACGHDFHMAIALGVLTKVINHPINDHMVFIFQPAEEGPGGAKPILESLEFQQWKPDMIFALHIAPEYPVGSVAVKEGLLFANTSELFIDLKGKGGHAAYPHQTIDMVVAGCSLVSQLQTIVSRNIDPLDSAVVTIGKITGGTVQNIIAENARIEGTIRTLSPTSMNKVKQRIEAIVQGVEVGFECQAIIDYGSNYYQVYNDEALTAELISFTKEHQRTNLVVCKEAMTGEDFGYMLRDIPGFMFWLGVNSPFGLHHARLQPDEEAINFAIGYIVDYLHFKGNIS